MTIRLALLLLVLAFSSTAVFASNPVDMVISTQDKVKLSLWYQGVQASRDVGITHASDYVLPSEVLVPLKELESNRKR